MCIATLDGCRNPAITTWDVPKPPVNHGASGFSSINSTIQMILESPNLKKFGPRNKKQTWKKVEPPTLTFYLRKKYTPPGFLSTNFVPTDQGAFHFTTFSFDDATLTVQTGRLLGNPLVYEQCSKGNGGFFSQIFHEQKRCELWVIFPR